MEHDACKHNSGYCTYGACLQVFGGYSWANNYEVQAVNDIPDPTFALQELADRLVALERALHLSLS